MSIYLYCPKPDANVKSLATNLGATLVRHFDGMHLWRKRARVALYPGDSVICWGASLPEFNYVRVLNNLMVPLSEQERLYKLRQEIGLPACSTLTRDATPEKAKRNGYVGRTTYHDGGNDLLLGTKDPDYYVAMWSQLYDEVRVHSFNNRTIRIGMKIPRDGFKPVPLGEAWVPNSDLIHPTIRSWNGGWRVSYTDLKGIVSGLGSFRTMAHNTLKSLGYTFGTVDMGRSDGNTVIVGVGLAPDLLDSLSIDIYTRHITKWLNGEIPLEKEEA